MPVALQLHIVLPAQIARPALAQSRSRRGASERVCRGNCDTAIYWLMYTQPSAARGRCQQCPCQRLPLGVPGGCLISGGLPPVGGKIEIIYQSKPCNVIADTYDIANADARASRGPNPKVYSCTCHGCSATAVPDPPPVAVPVRSCSTALFAYPRWRDLNLRGETRLEAGTVYAGMKREVVPPLLHQLMDNPNPHFSSVCSTLLVREVHSDWAYGLPRLHHPVCI